MQLEGLFKKRIVWSKTDSLERDGEGLGNYQGEKELKGRIRHSDVQRQLAVEVLNLRPEGSLCFRLL